MNVAKKLHRYVPPQFINEHQTEYGVRDYDRQTFHVDGVGRLMDIRGNQCNGGTGMNMRGLWFKVYKLRSDTLKRDQKS